MADEEVIEEVVAPAEAVIAEPELPLEPEPVVAEEKVEEPVEAVVEPEKPIVDWKDKELKKKHAQLMEARRKAEEDAAKIAALEALAGARTGEGGDAAPIRQTISQAEIDAAADRKIAHDRYNENCNKAADEGQNTYGEEWRGAVQNLETLGGFSPATMNGLLATDNPAKVLFELGKNPDKYYQIMDLPFERQIIAMAEIAKAPAMTKKVSDAPAPVNPVGGRAAASSSSKTLTDNMDDDQAYAVLQEMRRKRVAARGR